MTGPRYFSSLVPLDEVSATERHPSRADLVSRRGAGELAGCLPSVVSRLERQGAIATVLDEAVVGADGRARCSWYRGSDAVALRALRSEKSPHHFEIQRSAAMWMLRIQGGSWGSIAGAFQLSKTRVQQIVAKYERILRWRARGAERWLERQTRARQRGGGGAEP